MKRFFAVLFCACGAASAELDAGTFASVDAGQPLEGWQNDILLAHNSVRSSTMPAPSPALDPLVWSPTVAAAAQRWAERCTFEHDMNSGYGENLFASSAVSNAAAVITSWQDEAANYTYETNTCTAGKICGHYTQVVWRTSKQLGCGKATCSANSPFGGGGTWYLWVCDYAPPGNYLGQKPY